MVFSSLLFIFRFFPIAMILYFITPIKYRNIILLVLSLMFYSWGEPKYIILMIISIFVDYYASQNIGKYRENKKKSKTFLLISIAFNLGVLFLFKYMNLLYSLPLGISFYTFQTMSYTIDVYRGQVKAEKNIINFATYVCLFPQLIAGPIVKYRDVRNELLYRKTSMDNVEDGVRLFILGLAKKVLIANNIGMLWIEVQKIGFNNVSTILGWLGILAFAFQIYFDFSGYSSMAIGIGKILGFKFPENFNFPYISCSISEFWRRWHITLGSWFKEYVYIPLGGNKVTHLRMYLNLFIIWALTGIWHGADYNFALWGLFFFILISIEKTFFLKILKRYKIFSHIYVIFFLLIGWVIFAINDISEMIVFFKRLFLFKYGIEWVYYLRNYFGIFLIATIFSTPIIEKYYKKIINKKFVDTAIMLILFLMCIAYLVDDTYNPFLYFRF